MKTLSTFLIFAACAAAAQNDRAGLQPGTLAEPWLTGGPNCLTVPDWQVHEYNEDFYILARIGLRGLREAVSVSDLRRQESSARRHWRSESGD